MNDKLNKILETLMKECLDLGISIGIKKEHYEQDVAHLRDNAKQKILDYFTFEIRAKKFIDHIRDHFKHEHPHWKVKCKICDKTINEICDKDNYPYVAIDDSAKERIQE